MATVINTQETAGPEGSRICPATGAGGGRRGAGRFSVGKVMRGQDTRAKGSRK